MSSNHQYNESKKCRDNTINEENKMVPQETRSFLRRGKNKFQLYVLSIRKQMYGKE